MNNNLKKLYKKLTLMRTYEHALSIMSFDFETCVPSKAMEQEGEVIAYFSNQHFKIKNSQAFKQLVIALNQDKTSLEPLDQILIKYLYDEYLKTKNITPKLQLEMSKIYNQAYIDWLNAKGKKDYRLFVPSFKKVIEVSKKEIALREKPLDDLYDNMLNDCERGMLQKELDVFFHDLKVGLIELIKKIKNSKKLLELIF